MPGDHVVFAIGNVLDLVIPASVSLGEVWRRANNDVARHLRVDVAKQRHHARLVKFEGTLLALRPGAEIVAFLLVAADRRPEHVVLYRIAVLELHRRPYLHDQDVRRKTRPFWSMTGCC